MQHSMVSACGWYPDRSLDRLQNVPSGEVLCLLPLQSNIL
jgi:hypothetical protein